MKIVFLARRGWPAIGGVETHLSVLCKHLIRMGHDITIIAEQHDPSLPVEETHDNVRYVRIPHDQLAGKTGIWKWMWQHKRELTRADIVHAHDVFWWLTPLLPELPKAKRYVTFHGYEPDMLPTWRRRLHRQLVVRATSGSIAVGQFIHDWYRIHTDAVIYGALDTADPSPAPNENSFCFVGRIAPDSGLLQYLDFLDALPYSATVDFYGAVGAEMSTLLDQWISGSKHTAVFHGLTDNPKQVIASHRYVLSSQYLSMLMAMQQKRLVLSVYGTPLKHDYLNCHPLREHFVCADTGKELASTFAKIEADDEKHHVDKAYEWARKQNGAHLADTYLSLWNL